MNILEIRTYRLKAGMSDAFHQLVAEQSVPMLRRFRIEVVRFGSSEQNELGVEEYVLIRAFASHAERNHREDRFYSSEEWLRGPRDAILALIESYHTVVLTVSSDAVDSLRAPS